MNNQLLPQLIDEYFEANPPPFFSFDYRKRIPLRKLKNARNRYAPYDDDKEHPLLLIDDTISRSAKKGILITDLHIFYRLYARGGSTEIKKGCIALNDINNIYIDIGRQGSYLMINNKKEAFTTAFGVDGFKRTEAEILNKLFGLLIESLDIIDI